MKPDGNSNNYVVGQLDAASLPAAAAVVNNCAAQHDSVGDPKFQRDRNPAMIRQLDIVVVVVVVDTNNQQQ